MEDVLELFVEKLFIESFERFERAMRRGDSQLTPFLAAKQLLQDMSVSFKPLEARPFKKWQTVEVRCKTPHYDIKNIEGADPSWTTVIGRIVEIHEDGDTDERISQFIEIEVCDLSGSLLLLQDIEDRSVYRTQKLCFEIDKDCEVVPFVPSF